MTTLFFQPLYNILALLSYLLKGNVGWAIFIFAVIIKMVFLPLSRRSALEQAKMTKIQPKMREIQEKFKNNPNGANKALKELFNRENINLAGSFRGIFIQLAVFVLLFFFLKEAVQLNDWTSHLYPFINIRPSLSYIFLGVINLQAPNLVLIIISAILNAIPILLQPASGNQNKTMLLFLPFAILFYWKMFPAAITVYWIAMSLFGVIEIIVSKKFLKMQTMKTMKTIK